jgi:hypothetical protein
MILRARCRPASVFTAWTLLASLASALDNYTTPVSFFYSVSIVKIREMLERKADIS